MASKYYDFEGTFYECKIHDPEVVFGKEQWTLIFVPKDEAELGKIMATGLKIRPTKDKYNGSSRVTFRRPTKREFSDGVVQFNPPSIYGAFKSVFIDKETGKKVNSYPEGSPSDNMVYQGEALPIPNGSKGRVNISVYDTAQGKGHRLEGLYITELAEEKVWKASEDKAIDDSEEEAVILDESAPW